MIKEIKMEEEAGEVTAFLKDDIENSLYIYVDITKYGISNPNMRVWKFLEEGRITGVLMQYHNGIWVYTREPFKDQEEVISLIYKLEPERIAGNLQAIKTLEPHFKEQYEAVYGVIMKRPGALVCERPEGDGEGRIAEVCDIPEIADLLLSEEEFGKQYSREELTEQLTERLATKMGRSMVLEKEGKIVAHVGTFAESESFVIFSGSVVRPEYRNTDCFERLHAEFDYLIAEVEKKDVYFFINNKRIIKVYSRLFEVCTEYGKLVKRKGV